MSKNINWLIFKHLLNELSEEESQQLNSWVETSDSNRRMFEKICNATNISQGFSNYKKVDKDKAFQDFLKKTGQQKKAKLFPSWTRYAAAAVLLIGMSLPLYQLLKQDTADNIVPGKPQAVLVKEDGSQVNLNAETENQITSNNHVVATNTGNQITYNSQDKKDINQRNTLLIPRGGEYTVTLSDGTVVHLNAESKLTYPIVFNSVEREVQLEGEAYFEIAKDPSRPFYVNIDGMKVKQYGTAFNVSTRQSPQIEIVLVHGSVSILSKISSSETYMQPSELATYNQETDLVSLKKVDIRSYVAWHYGQFIFDNKPLSEIMETLSLWYNVEVSFTKPILMEQTFSGTLSRDASIESILKAINFSANVEFSIQDNTITVTEK